MKTFVKASKSLAATPTATCGFVPLISLAYYPPLSGTCQLLTMLRRLLIYGKLVVRLLLWMLPWNGCCLLLTAVRLGKTMLVLTPYEWAAAVHYLLMGPPRVSLVFGADGVWKRVPTLIMWGCFPRTHLWSKFLLSYFLTLWKRKWLSWSLPFTLLPPKWRPCWLPMWLECLVSGHIVISRKSVDKQGLLSAKHWMAMTH